jgi:hypothetical protein
MPRHRNLLNVRAHLEHAAVIVEGLQKYGMCPAIQYELRKFMVFNRAILAKASKSRKDLRVEVQ